jgi:hypothetical protein
VAAIGIALEILSPGPIGSNAAQVASLAIQLLPEAAGFEAAMESKDYAAAGFELLSLSKRAMTIIADHYGSAAGTAGQGWYSYDLGAWHLIALNSNCGNVGGCNAISPQGEWLAADLAAHPNQCILAYWHIPLFSSGGRAAINSMPLWQQLYAAHADVVLDGHDHIYERFDPQDPNGIADPVNRIREFIVGTGGANHTSISAVAANSAVRDTTTFGVLALTLPASSYSWQFEPAVGTGTFTDSGSATCHSAGSGAMPTPTPTSTPTPTVAPTTSPGTLTVVPVADSYTDASAPTTNHGTATTMRVDGSPVVRSFLRFNVTGASGTVTTATLRVWANSAQSTGYDAYSVANNTWGETTITDANAPPFGAKLGSSGAVATGTWTSINVTSAVAGNGTFSFGLSTTNSTALSLSSREGANPPQLVVVFSGGVPAVAVPPAPSPGSPLPALFFLIPLIPVVILVRPARLAWQRAFVAPRALSNEPGFVTVLRMLLAGRSIATR